jgi:hypothetical protein
MVDIDTSIKYGEIGSISHKIIKHQQLENEVLIKTPATKINVSSTKANLLFLDESIHKTLSLYLRIGNITDIIKILKDHNCTTF